MAARSLQAELHQNYELAASGYEQLSSSRNSLARLLGVTLLAWMPQTGSSEIRRAVEFTSGLRERALVAKSMCRLLAIALDKGDLPLARELMDSTLSLVDPATELASQLNWVAYRFLGDELKATSVTKRSDQHATDEIDELRLTAGREFAVRQVETSALGPWRQPLRFGRSDSADLVTAEMQAQWSGASWLLPQIRLELGAQLLATSGSAQESAYGVACWVLGGGKEVWSVANQAEARFDQPTADNLLRQELGWGARAGGRTIRGGRVRPVGCCFQRHRSGAPPANKSVTRQKARLHICGGALGGPRPEASGNMVKQLCQS